MSLLIHNCATRRYSRFADGAGAGNSEECVTPDRRIAMVTQTAFASAQILLRMYPPRFCSSSVSSTPRRGRRFVLTPKARSLESYREGSRFERSDRRSPVPGDDQTKPIIRHKSRISLARALVMLHVASLETCALMIRSGRVRVNGDVVTDGKAKVDRFKDTLSANGIELGTLEGPEDSDSGEFEEDSTLLPRTQRDSKHTFDLRERKRYDRHIDGGFFSSRSHPRK